MEFCPTRSSSRRTQGTRHLCTHDVCVLSPPQGTLVGILSCYCEEGDTEGAMKMLSQMKSLDMAINENIYAALITGRALPCYGRIMCVPALPRPLSPW